MRQRLILNLFSENGAYHSPRATITESVFADSASPSWRFLSQLNYFCLSLRPPAHAHCRVSKIDWQLMKSNAFPCLLSLFLCTARHELYLRFILMVCVQGPQTQQGHHCDTGGFLQALSKCTWFYQPGRLALEWFAWVTFLAKLLSLSNNVLGLCYWDSNLFPIR